MIGPFRGKYSFLSNFYPVPEGAIITYEGLSAPTVEHAYQAEKCADSMDHRRVLAAPTPGAAKKLGNRYKMTDGWESIKLTVMLGLLRRKFAPNTELATQLLATGEEELIEVNTWGDRFWGAQWVPNTEQEGPYWALLGDNWLGRLLMEVRDELRGD